MEWLRNVGTTVGLLSLSVGLFALGALVVGGLFAALVVGLEFLPFPAGTEIVVLIGGWAIGLALLFSLPFFVTVTVSRVIELGDDWTRRRARRRSETTVEPEATDPVIEEQAIRRPR